MSPARNARKCLSDLADLVGAEGIEGLVHISELAERHVEIPEHVKSKAQDSVESVKK